jgi:hypothetical protein
MARHSRRLYSSPGSPYRGPSARPKCDHLGVPRHVAFVRHAVDGFGNDLAGAADHNTVGIFALLSRPDRECDTTHHHLTVDFVGLRASHAQPNIDQASRPDH